MSNIKAIYQYTKQWIFICCFISCFFLFTHPVFAAALPWQSLRVSPIINDLPLTPGKTTSFTITIDNLAPSPMGIQTSISGFDETGGNNTYAMKPSQMIYWTTLSQNQFLIGPHAQKTITVFIKTPAKLGPSGYYETIFLTPIVDQELSVNSPIILSRLGVLVLGTIGHLNYSDLAKKVTISNFTPSYTILNTFPQTISFTINNNYFTHFDAKPFLTIIPLFGKPKTVELEDLHVLPQDFKTWQYQVTDDSPYSFIYQMNLAVSIGNGYQIKQDTWFIVLPYKRVLVFILLIIILFYSIFKRDRIRKAWRIIKSP